MKLRKDEAWAMACIQAELEGAIVEAHDDHSAHSMYDLKIIYRDGSVGAVEVTAAHDSQRLELWQAVRKPKPRWQEPDLDGGWLVFLLPTARARELRRELPDLLRELEHRGRKARAGSLGIMELEQHPTDSAGSIYVMPPEGPGEQAGWSPTTGDALATWLSAWIAEPSRADNLSKLGNADADEQQLFFELPAFHAAPFEVNDLLNTPNAPLPIAAPSLPPAVTHL
ncbi:MAG TPA: hypothetical protein VL551_32445 [Actinospica sp.]|jgi:hypothetical protein|nr:hypothetical protein [Actinospica sp.]